MKARELVGLGERGREKKTVGGGGEGERARRAEEAQSRMGRQDLPQRARGCDLRPLCVCCTSACSIYFVPSTVPGAKVKATLSNSQSPCSSGVDSRLLSRQKINKTKTISE